MSHPAHPQIAVIGAGATGLQCARILEKAGLQVTVFDKSGDIGGRLATRRRENLHWNHGAPAADVVSETGLALINELEQAGTAARHNSRCFGRPDMRELLRPLAGASMLRCDHNIVRVAQSESGWQLYQQSPLQDNGEEVRVPGIYGAIVCTLPSAQARTLLAASALDSTSLLANVTTTACWALLLTLANPVEAKVVDCSHCVSIASLHPGNGLAATTRTWVAHCSAAWSQQALEWEPEQVVAAHTPDLAKALGCDESQLTRVKAHRWRYARTDQALGEACLAIPDTALVLAGDWCLGPTVDEALASGRAAAAAILEMSL